MTVFSLDLKSFFFDSVIPAICVRVYRCKKQLSTVSHIFWFINYLTFSKVGETLCFSKMLSFIGIGKGNLHFPHNKRKISDLQNIKCWQLAGNRDEWQAMFEGIPLGKAYSLLRLDENRIISKDFA